MVSVNNAERENRNSPTLNPAFGSLDKITPALFIAVDRRFVVPRLERVKLLELF